MTALAVYQNEHVFTGFYLSEDRYFLHALLASTALVTFYRGSDVKTIRHNQAAAELTIGIVNTALTQNVEFAAVLKKVFSRYHQGPARSHLYLNDFGVDNDQYWFVVSGFQGALLQTDINQIGRFGYPPAKAISIAESVIKATKKTPMASGYAFIEAGAISYEPSTRQAYLLNEPVVIAYHIFLTGQQTKQPHGLTLHAPALSPETAMGEVPVASDDTFAIAVLLYQLLNGYLPFIEDSSIQAAFKESIPNPVIKLPEENWQALYLGLAFRRAKRPESPERLLYLVDPAPKVSAELTYKIVYPVLIAGLAILTVIAGHHHYRQTTSTPAEQPFTAAGSLRQAPQPAETAAKPPHKTQPLELVATTKRAETAARTHYSIEKAPQMTIGKSLARTQQKIISWRNPNAFGPVPSHKKAQGMATCQQQGQVNVMGYHPNARDVNGKLIPGGGFLCQ